MNSLIKTFADNSAIIVLSKAGFNRSIIVPGSICSTFEVKAIFIAPTEQAIILLSDKFKEIYPNIKVGYASEKSSTCDKECGLIYATPGYVINLFLSGHFPFDTIFIDTTNIVIISLWFKYNESIRLVLLDSYIPSLPFELEQVKLNLETSDTLEVQYSTLDIISTINSLKISKGDIIVYASSIQDSIRLEYDLRKALPRYLVYSVYSNNHIEDGKRIFIVTNTSEASAFEKTTRTVIDQMLETKEHELSYISKQEAEQRSGNIYRPVRLMEKRKFKYLDDLTELNIQIDRAILTGISLIGVNTTKSTAMIKKFGLMKSPLREFVLSLPINVYNSLFLYKWLTSYSCLEGIMLTAIIETCNRPYAETSFYRGTTRFHTYYSMWIDFLDTIGYDPITDKRSNDIEKKWIKSNTVNSGRWKLLISTAKSIYDSLDKKYRSQELTEKITADEIVNRAIIILTDMYNDRIMDRIEGNIYEYQGKKYTLDDKNKLSDLEINPPKYIIFINTYKDKYISSAIEVQMKKEEQKKRWDFFIKDGTNVFPEYTIKHIRKELPILDIHSINIPYSKVKNDFYILPIDTRPPNRYIASYEDKVINITPEAENADLFISNFIELDWRSKDLTSISATITLYDLLQPTSILDPISSFGERAIAAHLTESVKQYTGFDTNINMLSGYKKINESLEDNRIYLNVGSRFDRDVLVNNTDADLIHLDSSKLTGTNSYPEDIPLHPMAWIFLIKRTRKRLLPKGNIVVYDSSKDQYGAGLASAELNNDPELKYLGAIGINEDKYLHIWNRNEILDLGVPYNIMEIISYI